MDLALLSSIRLARRYSRTLLQRSVSWLLLAFIVVSTAGIPIPQRKSAANDAPFPCQDRPCGCATAEACWRQCCCFTDDEKLKWAVEHGVTPPEFVVKAARAEHRSPSQCCASKRTPPAAPSGEQTEDVAATAAGVVLLDAYQRCRGLSSLIKILAEPWTEPPRHPAAAGPELLFLLAVADESPVSRPDAPEPPVP